MKTIRFYLGNSSNGNSSNGNSSNGDNSNGDHGNVAAVATRVMKGWLKEFYKKK